MEKSDTCISIDVPNISHSRVMLGVGNTFALRLLESARAALAARIGLVPNIGTNILKTKATSKGILLLF